uniref:Inhibitor of apoptosis 2 n=1 Tax=Timema shepardi TaxID=629360 RepID=A0A7R9B306_TIMSH|nr:unnamed protein product [Timema shepardi]
MASLVLTDSSQLTSDNQHLDFQLKKEVNIDDLGIQLHRGPKHPKYSTPESRLLTYSHWPRQLTRQTPETLVQAGFYYIGLSDQVRCFHCDGGLSSWDPTDDPFVEHARWFPHCGYITLVRGTQFVKDMLEEHPPVLASSNIGLNRTETNEANQNQVDIIDESSQSLAELVDTVLDIQSNSSQQDTSKVESRDMSQSMSTLHEKNSLATSQDEDEYHSISAVSTRSLELLPAQITYSSQVHKCVTLALELLLEPSAVFEVFSLIYLMVEKHLLLCFLLFFKCFPDLSLLFPLSFVGISSVS